MHTPKSTPIDPKNQLPTPVSFWAAFAFWLKLGFISFGGPAEQISLMHQELVENRAGRSWLSHSDVEKSPNDPFTSVNRIE